MDLYNQDTIGGQYKFMSFVLCIIEVVGDSRIIGKTFVWSLEDHPFCVSISETPLSEVSLYYHFHWIITLKYHDLRTPVHEAYVPLKGVHCTSNNNYCDFTAGVEHQSLPEHDGRVDPGGCDRLS